MTKFRETDVTKAVRAVLKAGAAVARVEVCGADGKPAVVVVIGKPGCEKSNEWDDLLHGQN